MSDAMTIEQIKLWWPDLNFTEANLQRPTPDIVFQLYSNYLMDFEEKFSYAGFNGDVKANLSPEELVFFKMQKFNGIFKQAGIEFRLSDIYQPTHIRTKSFLYMLNHFLIYLGNTVADLAKINEDVIKMREDTEKLFNRKNEIENDVIKLEEKKEQLMNNNKQLQQNIEAAENFLTEYCAKKSERERKIKENEKELESLKMSIDKKYSLINVLTAKEEQYLKQTITEEEYLNLKKLEDQLKTENESMKADVEQMEHEIAQNRKLSNHLKKCKNAIPDSFNSDLVNKHILLDKQLEDVRIQKDKLESDLRLLKVTQSNERKKLIDSENSYLSTNSEVNKLIKDIQQEFEQLSLTLQKEKDKISSGKIEVLSNMSTLKNELTQYEKDIRKLKEHFTKECIKITEAENARFSKIKNNLNELKKL